MAVESLILLCWGMDLLNSFGFWRWKLIVMVFRQGRWLLKWLYSCFFFLIFCFHMFLKWFWTCDLFIYLVIWTVRLWKVSVDFSFLFFLNMYLYVYLFVCRGYVGIHSSGFRDFLLKPELLRAIVDSGFEHPSEGKPLTLFSHFILLKKSCLVWFYFFMVSFFAETHMEFGWHA